MNEVNYSVAANLWAIPTYWECMILSLDMALGIYMKPHPFVENVFCCL